MLKLIKVPDKLLRQKSKPVKKVDSGIKTLVDEMVEFFHRQKSDETIPVGLAAPQVGELLRIILFRDNFTSTEKEDIKVVINPVITSAKGKCLSEEGCLSIPGKIYTVRRAKMVKIRGLNLDNEMRTFRGTGFLATVFQHEIDHLNGVLIDKIGVIRKK